MIVFDGSKFHIMAAEIPSSNVRGWRLPATSVSLPEVHGSISVPEGAGFWRKMVAFAGPGYLVAVGYMDPGNWATDLAGGAQFGYTLLSVILVSNLMRSFFRGWRPNLGSSPGAISRKRAATITRSRSRFSSGWRARSPSRPVTWRKSSERPSR